MKSCCNVLFGRLLQWKQFYTKKGNIRTIYIPLFFFWHILKLRKLFISALQYIKCTFIIEGGNLQLWRTWGLILWQTQIANQKAETNKRHHAPNSNNFNYFEHFSHTSTCTGTTKSSIMLQFELMSGLIRTTNTLTWATPVITFAESSCLER